MPISYASEKFGQALHAIVTSSLTQSPQDRVLTAVSATAVLRPEDFTPELWERYRKFHNALTRVEDDTRGSFAATAESLTDMEAHDLLVQFYDLLWDVERECNRAIAEGRQ